jgi:lipopolysaccharide export system permease protein
MKILNRYIRNVVISATILVILVILGVECFAQLVGQLPSVGTANYGVGMMLKYIAMELPAILYMAFPIAAFIGCLIGLGRLATGSELTVMRANGVSIGQITWSVVKAALIMVVIVTAIGEFIAPQLQVRADIMKANALGKSSRLEADKQIWLHHDNKYIYIDNIDGPTHITDINEFKFNGKQLHELIYAKSADKIGKRWQLHDVVTTVLNDDHTQVFRDKSAWLNFNFVPNKLHKFKSLTLQGSLVYLWQIVKLRKSVGLVATLFELTFWQRAIQPITTLVMICLGIPFIFGSLRSVGTSVRLVAGISVGIIFYMLNRFFGPITLLYQFPPILAALCPTLLFLAIYAYMLKRIS